MSDTATVQTGAALAADAVAVKLKAAGWETRISRHNTTPPAFDDGTPMYKPFRSVFIHADGPASIGRPYLSLCWHQMAGSPVKFSGAIRMRGQDDAREFTTETEFAAWLDVLLAVAAALDA